MVAYPWKGAISSMKNVLVEQNGAIATVTINRPKSLNALNTETLKELSEAFKSLGHKVQVVILTGSGDRAFVAGADIAEMKDFNALQARDMARFSQELFSEIEKGEKVVIGAINGFALGGGCELAMACDIRLASENAKFGQPEVSLGIIPGFGGTQRLSRLVGKGIAKEIVLTGEMINAQRAKEIGLVNHICSQENLLKEAKAMAEKILNNSPFGISTAKHAIDRGYNMDDETAFAYEADLFGVCFSMPDQAEGMAAFLEKRSPTFDEKKG